MKPNRFKFRGWSQKENWMIGPCGFEGFADGYMDFTGLQTKDLILMQSTGVLDKNGKEIFEGDLVERSNNFIGKVEWDDSSCNFRVDHEKLLPWYFEESNEWEVVGNIYQNSELAKGEK